MDSEWLSFHNTPISVRNRPYRNPNVRVFTTRLLWVCRRLCYLILSLIPHQRYKAKLGSLRKWHSQAKSLKVVVINNYIDDTMILLQNLKLGDWQHDSLSFKRPKWAPYTNNCKLYKVPEVYFVCSLGKISVVLGMFITLDVFRKWFICCKK